MNRVVLTASLFIVGAERAPRPLRRLFELEVVVLDCAVLFVCKGIDVEEFQRFDEGNEFLVAEIADVEVGELLAQEISQGTRENPAVVVGIFFGQLDERLTDARSRLFKLMGRIGNEVELQQATSIYGG